MQNDEHFSDPTISLKNKDNCFTVIFVTDKSVALFSLDWLLLETIKKDPVVQLIRYVQQNCYCISPF